MRKKRGAYHHGSLRESMLAGALEIVETDGVHGLSLRDVARRLNVSHQAPYRHFSDKRALLDAIAADGFTALIDVLRTTAARHDPPEARLVALGCSYVQFAVDRPAHYRVMFGERGSPHGVLPAPNAEGLAFTVLVDVIRDGQALGVFVGDQPAPVALASFAFVHGLAMLAIDGKIERITAPMIRGLVSQHVVGTLRHGTGKP